MDEHQQLVRRFAGLGDEDRRWLMANMTPAQRRRLTLALANGNGVPSGSVEDRGQTDVIADAGVVDVAAVLAQEPAWIIAALLAQREWPWRAQYLASLEGDRREDVLRALGQVNERVAEGARIAVLQCVAERLRERSPKANVAADSSFEVLLVQAEQGSPRANGRSARWKWRNLWNR